MKLQVTFGVDADWAGEDGKPAEAGDTLRQRIRRDQALARRVEAGVAQTIAVLPDDVVAAEFDVPDGTANPTGEALVKLDAFRDGAAGHSLVEHGITLYQPRRARRPRKVYIVMRNESERRVCLRAFKTEVGAKQAIVEDINELDGIYDATDYDILPSTLAD